jgi:hypothetical protein
MDKKRHNCVGGGGTHHSPPRWIEPKPSAGGVAHGVWMAPVRSIGDGRGQSRRPPWCAGNKFRVLTQALKNSLPQHVEVRYSSTYVEEEKKGRVRTRDKLVRVSPFFHFFSKKGHSRFQILRRQIFTSRLFDVQ